MVTASIARTINSTTLNGIFERSATQQYTRELTFSTLCGLMTQVVFRATPSIHASYRKCDSLPVSITSVYNKINGVELGVSQAVVAETAVLMRDVLTALPAPPDEPVKGFRLRVLDGNALAGTDHRLGCLRGSGAAALPGLTLVVRDGRSGLLTNIVPAEDAYTNERSLCSDIMTLVAKFDLWMGDRNFCTDDFLSGIEAREAFFLIRHHAGSKLHPLEPESRRRSYPEAMISEQRVRVGTVECRCVIMRLKKPLSDGTVELRLLTNMPVKSLSALRVSTLYRTRWRIETAFQELTMSLRCEIDTLGYPKAALFGFAMAVVAYNLLVLTRAAMASGLGEEIGGVEALSSYHMAIEIESVRQGLSIAVPCSAWQRFVAMTAAEFAEWLDETASRCDWRRYRKNPRGPKKPVVVKRTKRGGHRSTARELKKDQE